jgi:hypothetical protein
MFPVHWKISFSQDLNRMNLGLWKVLIDVKPVMADMIQP